MKLNPKSDKSVKRLNTELTAKSRTRGWLVEQDESGNWVAVPGGPLSFEFASSDTRILSIIYTFAHQNRKGKGR